MELIGGWYWIFCAGNLLADFGIAVFAIKIGYLDQKLDKLYERNEIISNLFELIFSDNNLMRGLDEINTEVFLNLIKKLSENDLEKITGGRAAGYNIKIDMLGQPDLIKRSYFSSFVRNEGKLLNLYNEAGTDFLKTKNSILYKNINYIILIPFLSGVLIQVISLFFAKYIALLAIIISFSPIWFAFILLIKSLGMAACRM